jgi:hypothetical protein
MDDIRRTMLTFVSEWCLTFYGGIWTPLRQSMPMFDWTSSGLHKRRAHD